MRSLLLRARESFWFLPTIFGVGAIILALLLIEADVLLIGAGITHLPVLADLSATGGRAILTTIGGTMLGVAATSFSITISVLATTSSAYGPRLVRNFMADRGNQIVLSVLTATFLYALTVLRAVRTEDDASAAFVPTLSISAALVFAVADVAVLVYFIHHIATSVQVSTLQSRALEELRAVIELVYPDADDPRADRENAEPLLAAGGAPIAAAESGYVAYLDLDGLRDAARKDASIYEVVSAPGEYVRAGDTVIIRHGAQSHEVDDKDASKCVVVGRQRTPHQDARFALQQLIETGVRGLASGTNDPYTAVSAFDFIGDALSHICERGHARGPLRDTDGSIRVLIPWPDPSELVHDVFLAARTYGTEHPAVVEAIVRLAHRLAGAAHGDTRAVLDTEVRQFLAAYERTQSRQPEAATVRAAFEGSISKLE